MIRIPRHITKIITSKDNKTKIRNYELIKVNPYNVVYRCIETEMIESFTKNDFYTKEDKENDNITNEAVEL